MEFLSRNDILIVSSLTQNNVSTFDYFIGEKRSDIMVECAINNIDTGNVDGILNVSLTDLIDNEIILILDTKELYSKYGLTNPGLSINTSELLKNLGYISGHFSVNYKFYLDILGTDSPDKKMFIKKISSSRKELLLDYTNDELSEDVQTLSRREFWRYGPKFRFDKFANFGNGVWINVVNAKAERDLENGTWNSVIKLYSKLPFDKNEKDPLWLVKLITDEIIHDAVLEATPIDEYINILKRPDYNFVNKSSDQTQYKNYYDILSTKQSIIDLYKTSENINNFQLNVDYSNYSNFVKYSSASERLLNFKTKLNLISRCEYSQSISSESGSEHTSGSVNYWKKLREDTLNSFTPYERYLYFGSGKFYVSGSTEIETSWPKYFNVTASYGDAAENRLYSSPILYQYRVNHYVYTSASVTPLSVSESLVTGIGSNWLLNGIYPGNSIIGFGSSISTWYNVVRVISNTELVISGNVTASPGPCIVYESKTPAVDWYATMSQIASEYDNSNRDYLVYTTPSFIQDEAEDNIDYMTFLPMVGEIYDELHSYIIGMEKISRRENVINEGVPVNILWNVLKSFGFDIDNAGDLVHLSDYNYGIQLNTSASVEYEYLKTAEKEVTQQIWNRLLNNSMYIYKSKGTQRSIRALLNCFGISPDLVSIREFGGPTKGENINRFYEQNVVDYTHVVNFTGVESISIPWKKSEYFGGAYRYPDSIEAKFRTTNQSDMVLFDMCSSEYPTTGHKLELIHSTDSKGYLKYTLYSVAGQLFMTSSIFSYYSGEYYNILVKRLEENDNVLNSHTYALNVINHDEYLNKIITNETSYLHVTSSIFNLAYCTTGNIYLAGRTGSFVGSMDEFRLWNEILSDNTFEWHAKYSLATNGNTISSSLSNLLVRVSFNEPYNLYLTSSLPNDAFHLNYMETASAIGFSSSSYYNEYPYHFSYYERNNTISLKYITPTSNNSNKVRIEKNYINQQITLKDGTLVYPLKSDYYDGIKDMWGRTQIIKGEKSEYDNADQDSDRLIIGFTPSELLNNDIIAFFGDVNLLNEIGDYAYALSDSYPSINHLRYLYYDNTKTIIDIKSYIKYLQYFDKTLFNVLKQIVPIKSNPVIGIVYEENILHRNKVGIGIDFTDNITQMPYFAGAINYDKFGLTITSANNFKQFVSPINIGVEVNSSYQKSIEPINITLPWIISADNYGNIDNEAILNMPHKFYIYSDFAGNALIDSISTISINGNNLSTSVILDTSQHRNIDIHNNYLESNITKPLEENLITSNEYLETSILDSYLTDIYITKQQLDSSINNTFEKNIFVSAEGFDVDMDMIDNKHISVDFQDSWASLNILPESRIIYGSNEYLYTSIDTQENTDIFIDSKYLESSLPASPTNNIFGKLTIYDSTVDIYSNMLLLKQYESSDSTWVDSSGSVHTLGKYSGNKNVKTVDTMRYDFSVKSKNVATFSKSNLSRYEYDVTGPTGCVSNSVSFFRQELNIFRRNTVMTSNDTPDKTPVVEKWYVDPKTLKVNYYDNPRLIVE